MDARERGVGVAGGLLAALAVAAGAFGAHVLQDALPPERLETFRTAVRYQFHHALGLLVVALLAGRGAAGPLSWAARLLVAGVLLFCGSLYALAFGAPRWLGAVAPLGGLGLIVAWLLVAGAVWRGPDSAS